MSEKHALIYIAMWCQVRDGSNAFNMQLLQTGNRFMYKWINIKPGNKDSWEMGGNNAFKVQLQYRHQSANM